MTAAMTSAMTTAITTAMTAADALFAFDDARCAQLAEEHGTPCFAYRVDVALAQLERLRSALPERVRVAYAVKANHHETLLAAFAEAGASFDCASLGELDRLVRLGVSAEGIFFAGPAKRDHEIATAVSRGVRIQAEGLEDLERIDAAAERLGLREVAVNLRVQPLGVEETGAILGGSGPTAFGIDEEDLDAVMSRALRLERTKIRGLHGFAASNELDADRLLVTHGRMFEIGQRLQADWGLALEQIDLGGGLGVPYADGEAALDVDAFGGGLSSLLDENPWFRGELIVEPGRYLAAGCGVYLCRVVRTKTSRGERFALLEGGIHHLLRPLLTGQPFPTRLVGREEGGTGGQSRPTTLAGPLCTGLDRLGRVELPELRPGDLLAFGMVGAYGATEAMVRFLDHPEAKEVWVRDCG